MRAVDIVRKKREGHALSVAEIDWMVAGIGREVADYQWSALLMAILWRGMDDAETAALTDAMLRSGSVVDLSASIMSKKLAEGIDGLVLDVKTGNGAFMEKLEDSRALARAMVAIGRGLGVRMRALITRMDQPLGRAVGNAVEIAECVECLRGEGPDDLMELSIELAAEMVVMGERARTLDEARVLCRKTVADGSALE